MLLLRGVPINPLAQGARRRAWGLNGQNRISGLGWIWGLGFSRVGFRVDLGLGLSCLGFRVGVGASIVRAGLWGHACSIGTIEKQLEKEHGEREGNGVHIGVCRASCKAGAKEMGTRL